MYHVYFLLQSFKLCNNIFWGRTLFLTFSCSLFVLHACQAISCQNFTSSIKYQGKEEERWKYLVQKPIPALHTLAKCREVESSGEERELKGVTRNKYETIKLKKEGDKRKINLKFYISHEDFHCSSKMEFLFL